MKYSTLEVKQEGHIAHVVLNRPEAMNSMIPEFWIELPAAIREIDDVSLLSHGYSTSRTCEIGMMSNSNTSYRSIAYLVRDYLNQRVN